MSKDAVIELHGAGIKGMKGGWARGEVLKLDRPLSFLGDVDPEKGVLLCQGLEGVRVDERVLVFPEGKGSTVGSYVIYNLKIYGHSPAAMLMEVSDAVVAIGCILANVPLVHRISHDDLRQVETGDIAEVDSARGLALIRRAGASSS